MNIDETTLWESMKEISLVMDRITGQMKDISVRSQLNTDVREMREIDGS
jgi:hypothetical protein